MLVCFLFFCIHVHMRNPASRFCFIYQFGLNLCPWIDWVKYKNDKKEDRFPLRVMQYLIDLVDDKDCCVSWGTSVDIDCYFVSVSKTNRKYGSYKSFLNQLLRCFRPRPKLRTTQKQNQRSHFMFSTPSQQKIVVTNTVWNH